MGRHDIRETPGLNIFQRQIARTFAQGEYAWLLKSRAWRQDLEAADGVDPVFRFLMLELATREDCDTIDEAQRRVESAIGDLEEAWKQLHFLRKDKVA